MGFFVQLLLIIGLILLFFSSFYGFFLRLLVWIMGKKILDRVREDFHEKNEHEEYEIVRDGSDFRVVKKTVDGPSRNKLAERKRQKENDSKKRDRGADDGKNALHVVFEEVV